MREEEEHTIIDYYEEFQSLDFFDESTMNNIADSFELCRSSCNVKYRSILLCITMQHFGVTWSDCDDSLKEIGALKSEIAYEWIRTFVFGKFDKFYKKYCGGKHNSNLYNYFLELDVQGKISVLEQYSKKPADFTGKHLANFLDSKF